VPAITEPQAASGKPTRRAGPPAARAPEAARQQRHSSTRKPLRGAAKLVSVHEVGGLAQDAPAETCLRRRNGHLPGIICRRLQITADLYGCGCSAPANERHSYPGYMRAGGGGRIRSSWCPPILRVWPWSVVRVRSPGGQEYIAAGRAGAQRAGSGGHRSPAGVPAGVRLSPAGRCWRQLERAWLAACKTMACRSARLNATGLPCLLLEAAALAAISPACCGPMPNAARPGDGELGEGLPDSGPPIPDRGGGLAGQQPGRLVVAVNGRPARIAAPARWSR
jgi:hypothetical protein